MIRMLDTPFAVIASFTVQGLQLVPRPAALTDVPVPRLEIVVDPVIVAGLVQYVRSPLALPAPVMLKTARFKLLIFTAALKVISNAS